MDNPNNPTPDSLNIRVRYLVAKLQLQGRPVPYRTVPYRPGQDRRQYEPPKYRSIWKSAKAQRSILLADTVMSLILGWHCVHRRIQMTVSLQCFLLKLEVRDRPPDRSDLDFIDCQWRLSSDWVLVRRRIHDWVWRNMQ